MKKLILAALLGCAAPSWGLGGAITQTPEPVLGAAISPSTVTITGTGSKCLSVDDPTLTVDCNLNRVGVGVAAPAATVDVQGTANLDTVQLSGINSTGVSYGLRVAAGTNSSDRTATFLSASGGSTHLYIRGDGNVGLGTASPEEKLHVSGGAIALDNNREIRWDDVGGTLRTMLVFDSSNRLQVGSSSFDLDLNGGSATSIRISGGTMIMNGPVRLQSRTIAQLQAVAPGAAGEQYYCSDCSPSKIVVSTGTSAGNFADAIGGEFR